MSALTAFICGTAVGTLAMVWRVNRGYGHDTEKNTTERNYSMKNIIVGRTRRGRVVRLVALLMTVGTAAFAAILLWTLGVKGTIGVKQAPALAWTEVAMDFASSNDRTYAPVVTGDGSGIKGTATIADAGKSLNLGITDAYAGTSATVKAYATTSQPDLVLAGIDLGPSVEATVTPGLTLHNNNTRKSLGCGDPLTVVVPSATVPGPVTSEANPIAFTVTVPTTATANITLPSEVGIKAVPASQWDAMPTAEKAAMCKQAAN